MEKDASRNQLDLLYAQHQVSCSTAEKAFEKKTLLVVFNAMYLCPKPILVILNILCDCGVVCTPAPPAWVSMVLCIILEGTEELAGM